MILVTGATGNVGADVLRGLLQIGVPARAAVTDPERSRTKLPGGGEVVRFDFEDISTFDAALDGVTRVFLMRPPKLSDPKAFQPFLEAMRARNLEQVVFLSLLGAQSNAFVPHRKLELRIAKLDLPHVFLRPSFFLQSFFGNHREDIIDRNDLFVPAGSGRTSFIDTRDVAAVAVRALNAPHIVNGGIDLTGGAALTYSELAQVFSHELGRTITYSNPSIPEFNRVMRQRGIEAEYVAVMTLIYTINRFGLAARVTSDVRRILGREPITPAQFVRDFKDQFSKN
jgi:uncharacterized protein YbjT (DUF2867 family)